MKLLSTGDPSTLKTYRKLAELLFPKALPMLDARIKRFGEDEEILQDEQQMIYLLGQIELNNAPEHPAVIFTKREIHDAYGITESEPEEDSSD